MVICPALKENMVLVGILKQNFNQFMHLNTCTAQATVK